VTGTADARRPVRYGVGAEVAMGGGREQVAAAVRLQTVGQPVWEAAEACVVEVQLRERLAALGIAATPDIAVAMMATALLLAEHAPEFGGDSRDTLGLVAQLGLALLDG
jgi:hypothetical protein